MRAPLALLALTLAIAGCDSGTVPSPADRQAGTDAAEEVDLGLVALHGEGMVAGAESFFFAAGQREVETALAGVLGKAADTAEMSECGAGPMEATSFSGGLTVNFQDGKFVGWNLRRVEVSGAENIVMDADVTIGMATDALENIAGYSPVEGSTLGEEFSVGNDLGGFVEEGEVAMLYAGTQCFFR